MFRTVLLVLCVLMSVTRLAWGFASWDDGTSSVEARGAADVSGIFSGYPQPRFLYPEQYEGLGDATFRLLFDARSGNWLRFELNGYQELSGLSRNESLMNYSESYRTRYLKYDWIKHGNMSAPIVADQVKFTFVANPIDIQVGRQPINLANNFLFTPNDLFHPFSPTAVDRAFRPGVDAVRVNVSISSLARLSVIGVFGYNDKDSPDWEHSAAIFFGGFNAAKFDWQFLGGKAEGRYLAGSAFSGEVSRFGLRAEGNASLPTQGNKRIYGQAAAGMDYKWDYHNFQLIAEYYFHGNGEIDPNRYLNSLYSQYFLDDPYMGTHYVGASFRADATALLNVQATVLANVADPSGIFSPGLTYNAANDVEFILYSLVPLGRQPYMKDFFPPPPSGALLRKIDNLPQFPALRSEYGTYPWSVMVQTRIYF